MDEKGTQLGSLVSDKVLFSKAVGPVVTASSSTLNWVSIVESCTATGQALPPLIVHMGQEPRTTWFEDPRDIDPDWKYDFSTSGWSNSDIAIRWLREILIPYLDGEKGLLFLDGHDTHITPGFVSIARQNRVFLVLIPLNTTYIL